eukprot:3525181-Prorocentrum_lima.AAC.1
MAWLCLVPLRLEWDSQESFQFWSSLGLEPELAEELSDLGLRWEGQQLLVDQRHCGAENLLERITGCILGSLRFRKCCDS